MTELQSQGCRAGCQSRYARWFFHRRNCCPASAAFRSGLTLVCLAFILTGCSQPLTTQQRVIAEIRDMEAHFEDAERRPFMDHISKNFSGQNDSMNHDQLNAYMLYNMRRYDRLQAKVFPILVREQPDGSAVATFKALITGGASWLPESGQMLNITTRWALEDEEWMLVAADWDPLELEKILN